MLIPDRVWELMTTDEQEAVRLIVDGWKFQPTTECPSCGVRLGFKVRITTAAVLLDEQPVTPPTALDVRLGSWEGTLSEAERRVLQEAKEVGLLAAFKQAVEEEKGAQAPQNIGKFLFEFLMNARLDVVPRFVMDEYKDAFDGRVDFYSSQGIFAVTADGAMRAFFPKSRLVGRGVKRNVAGSLGAAFRSDDRMVEWIRGRFGYVPRECHAFSAALRQRNVGKFGAIVQ